MAMEFLKTDSKTVKSQGKVSPWQQSTMRRFCLRNCIAVVGNKANFVLSHGEGIFLLLSNGVRDSDTKVDHVIAFDADEKVVWDFRHEIWFEHGFVCS